MPYNYSNYSNRHTGYNHHDDQYDTHDGHRHDDVDDEEEDGIKPYTAVGAALDSAERFKRRMNYGRKPTNT